VPVLRRLRKLREQREDKYLSVRELAEKAGVSKSTVVALETGRTRAQPRTLRKLAEALGVRPHLLVG
jgi:transcriptional regulator with XRE-family HTH domain